MHLFVCFKLKVCYIYACISFCTLCHGTTTNFNVFFFKFFDRPKQRNEVEGKHLFFQYIFQTTAENCGVILCLALPTRWFAEPHFAYQIF